MQDAAAPPASPPVLRMRALCKTYGSGVIDAELAQYRREHVGFVFQCYNLVPSLTVRENGALVTDIASSPMPIGDALAQVALTPRRDHFPSQLSGGEQQRGAALTLPVTLARHSSLPPSAPAPPPEWRQGLGLELTEPSASHLLQLRAANGLVQDAAGLARSDGIRAGDLIVALNDTPVARIADFQRLLKQASPGSSVALLVQRDGRLAYVPVRMPARPAP